MGVFSCNEEKQNITSATRYRFENVLHSTRFGGVWGSNLPCEGCADSIVLLRGHVFGDVGVVVQRSPNVSRDQD